ncbi:MAG: tRNA preQ1(34) S-adenosylmethionine ribosyltransferase-isomerase QueA [Oscillospiraceae bacterium]|jgi:S-adenosylmethionine:tRNA ribosyltransferase-isomerase|nr:tRNA preQ1(34) S-adenosylmethionine ribosyltransferase-isomerase QueA [Oscillospiraceae bacterium]
MTLPRKDFYYHLPPELIAQKPTGERDASRLLVYDRGDKTMAHRHFGDILDYLRPGDALVLNETRVIPARLHGVRRGTGAGVEFLLLRRVQGEDWQTLARPGKKARVGDVFDFGAGLSATVTALEADGVRVARFACPGPLEEALAEVGETPLPPYITEKLRDPERYQTVYARQSGSAAAPTAGLHFTPRLLDAIRAKGVHIVPILLHVGLGTFRPVKEDDALRHRMHSEYYEVTQEAAHRINAARAAGGRVFAVGTTSVRTLETVADAGGALRAQAGFTDIFIYPGYRFKAVDALITNFHLPESTLLMLVSAWMGREEALAMYEEAVRRQYLFFSLGDACLIL